MSAHATLTADGSLKPPLGISDFGRLYREGYTFVDKSLLIREVLEDSAAVTLITRPRRFGKTLNLSMLHHFFASEVSGHPTRRMFGYLAVSRDEEIMAHQGQYSVIFVTLKDIKESTFAQAGKKLTGLLSALYREHRELLQSPRLSVEQKRDLRRVLAKKTDLTELTNALKNLCECLLTHHGKPVVLLIDEYDTPMHAAYLNGYLDDMLGFMRGFLGAALKDNSFLHKAIVTGVLRVSKENLFTGLNNLAVNTVLSRDYSRWFGFTEKDVAELLTLLCPDAAHRQALSERVRAWYNGYRFGDQVMYNPWSIVSCLKYDGAVEPYWINTSDNALIKEVAGRSVADVKQELEKFLRGETLEKVLDPNLVFSDFARGGDALWPLLLFTGYLTASGPQVDRRGYVTCRLCVPNHEVMGLYEKTIEEWFTDRMSTEGYAKFLHSLLSGDLDEFKARLEDYLRDSMSMFDAGGHHPENFYHGLVLGLMFGVRESHVVYSNRESGYGRYDVALLPKDAGGTGFILEFKRAAESAPLDATAQEALRQIDERWYQVELRQHGVERVMKIGMAFCGKRVEIRSLMESRLAA